MNYGVFESTGLGLELESSLVLRKVSRLRPRSRSPRAVSTRESRAPRAPGGGWPGRESHIPVGGRVTVLASGLSLPSSRLVPFDFQGSGRTGWPRVRAVHPPTAGSLSGAAQIEAEFLDPCQLPGGELAQVVVAVSPLR